jgi:hypothetical protein
LYERGDVIMWQWLIPLGVNILSNILSPSKTPKAPERMPYEDALSQAEESMRPQYEQGRERVLGDIEKNLISRGFYGQAPGDAFTAGTMADMESDYQGQLSQAATNLQSQQYAQDYQTYQTNLQQANQVDPFWYSLGQLTGQYMAGPGGEAMSSWWGSGNTGGGAAGGAGGGGYSRYTLY